MLSCRTRSRSPFRDGASVPDWWEGFLGWWPSLLERKPQDLSTRQSMESWFATMQNFLVKKHLLKWTGPVVDYPSPIWNTDETELCLWSQQEDPC